MPKYRNDPRIITARYDSKCAETGELIKKGESCLYYPNSRQVFSLGSRQYAIYCEQQHDMALEDANAERYGY